MNYTLIISSLIAIVIALIIGLTGSTENTDVVIEVESHTETRYFSYQFNNVSGMSIANETIYNGSCNVLIEITAMFDTEFGNITLFVDDEEILSTRNNTNLEVAGTNLTITIHASGGDSYPDSLMADYYVVKMISNCG